MMPQCIVLGRLISGALEGLWIGFRERHDDRSGCEL